MKTIELTDSYSTTQVCAEIRKREVSLFTRLSELLFSRAKVKAEDSAAVGMVREATDGLLELANYRCLPFTSTTLFRAPRERRGIWR